MHLDLALLRVVLALFLASTPASPNSICRYSVRDVGFVNVHGQPWQLKVVRPAVADQDQVSSWQSAIRSQLEESNVTFEWVRSDSQSAKKIQILSSTKPPLGLPTAAIYGPNDLAFPVPFPENLTSDELEKTLDSIVHSPVRDRILDEITSTLCTILVVESGDSDFDRKAVEIANSAAEQISNKMWLMEKPTKKGPVVEVLESEERDQEQWLIRSLGLDLEATVPQLVIVYGQGRRLGDPLIGQDILEGRIVQLASLCGQSCECELDRFWLYGTQMIHFWGDKRAARAERHLDFDPGAALVIAEVNGIVGRAGRGNKRSDSLIGNGLVIHDLPDIADVEKETNLRTESDESTVEMAEHDKNSDPPGKDVLKSTDPGRPSSTEHVAAESGDQGGGSDTLSSRWILLIVAVSIVLAIAIFAMARGRD